MSQEKNMLLYTKVSETSLQFFQTGVALCAYPLTHSNVRVFAYMNHLLTLPHSYIINRHSPFFTCARSRARCCRTFRARSFSARGARYMRDGLCVCVLGVRGVIMVGGTVTGGTGGKVHA